MQPSNSEDYRPRTLASHLSDSFIINAFGPWLLALACREHAAALGCRPCVRFEDGMAELVNWVRHQQAADAFERAREELARRGLAG